MSSTQTSSSNSSPDSAQLYYACQSDDQATRTDAYQTLWTYLYRVALKIVYDQPDGPALAQDCAQTALIRVHDRIDECQGPPSFRAWARQIVSHLAIDALRRRKRLNPIDNGHEESDSDSTLTDEGPGPESIVVKELRLDELQNLLNQSPISERSRRVVLGRYVADEPDEALAEAEAKLSGQTVLPSHIQVTRSKNLSKLRDWAPLRTYFEQTG